MKNNFTEFVLKHFGIFLYFTLSNIFIIIIFNYINIGYEFLKFTKHIIVSTFILICILFLLAYIIQKIIKIFVKNNLIVNYISKILKWGGVLLTLTIGIINIILIINFNTLFSYNATIAIANTNIQECIEFISVYLNIKTIISVLIFTILSIIICKISFKFNVKNKTNLIIIITIILLFLNDIRRTIKLNNYERLNSIPIICFVKNIFVNDDLYIEFEKIYDSYKKIAENHKKLVAENNIKNIILIIGESSRRDAYQDYGQTLQTTPNILKINNKIIFNDIISPYTFTYKTLSMLLNFSNLDSEKNKKFYNNLDIISLFNLSDYVTNWISNQEYDNITGPISKMANNEYFINKKINVDTLMRIQKLDEFLLPIINKYKNQYINHKSFYIVHLLGNHSDYIKRYSKEFEYFTANDINSELERKEKQIVANYYNSILYTDFIISKIFEIFKDEDSIIIYLSDHGEILKDSKKNNIFGHGIIDKLTVEIPFIIFYSDTFKLLHEDLIKRLEKSKNLPFMTDDLIHLICDIAGIKTDEFISERSLINNKYNTNRERNIENTINYDKFLKNN
ncbi:MULTISPECIES: phosphoethanolamine transferase [unclassified Campylobacter]|uniref:phosphoethanolamine transferase n=1 Tax=unclassified Campylobacter TaxID=2593542 RepID=UPI001D59368F|nr:phosphoethanolamine transferase [Campylobacter sp. RM9331]MBZ8004954.1 phosphoethanolamine transferase [Campylobacter sp. RM9332]